MPISCAKVRRPKRDVPDVAEPVGPTLSLLIRAALRAIIIGKSRTEEDQYENSGLLLSLPVVRPGCERSRSGAIRCSRIEYRQGSNPKMARAPRTNEAAGNCRRS